MWVILEIGKIEVFKRKIGYRRNFKFIGDIVRIFVGDLFFYVIIGYLVVYNWVDVRLVYVYIRNGFGCGI